MIALVLVLLFAISLIAGPVVADSLGHGLGSVTSAVMVVSGIALSIVSGVLMIVAKLYQKTKANEALVRTGMGGMRVIKDGGAIVIPVVHQILGVPLESIRLEMERKGADGLITGDKLRADIKAEFFVRVMAVDDDIMNAARSLGDKLRDAEQVRKLVEDKLVSALRNAAAKKTLEELNSNRDSFMEEVVKIVTTDLKHNGLTLESVTISKLDQANAKDLNPNNIFDAQGLRTIAEITQANQTKRNQLEREGERARTEQDVQTRQQVLALEQTRAQAEAEQGAQISQIQAEQTRLAQEKQIATTRAVELATVEKTQALEVAEMQKQSATQVAERAKQEAITAADQKVEVAKRKQAEAIANAEAQKAVAEAKRAEAEALAEKERQNITTVQVQAAADREKQQKVTMAEAEAQTNLITQQKQADAKAYAVQKDADARKAAADADATATTKKAEAESKAAELKATGDRAIMMVPVDVKKAEVDVEQKRVDVLKQELEARAEHGQVAQDFEIAKLRIVKEAEIRIAAAGSMAELMGSVKAQVFGTPKDVADMTNRFMQGMGIANMAEGFLSGAGPETTAGVEQAVGMIKALATKLGVSPEALASAEKVIEAPKQGSKTTEGGNGKTTD